MNSKISVLSRSSFLRSSGRRLLLSLATIAAVGCSLSAGLAQAPTLVLSNKWSVAAGTRTDLSASGDNTRGIAINKTTGNVLWSTRGSGGKIYIVSGTDGSDVAAINTSGFSLGADPGPGPSGR